MKLIKFCGAVLVALGMTNLADAGLLGHHRSCGAAKGCGCAPTCQPACCKPVIVKPCCPNVYTYQRKCSDIKPPCCDQCCAPASCCAPAARNCGPACAPACAAPAACGPAAAPACAAPAACGPAAAPACAAPAAACAPACAAPAACTTSCTPSCGVKHRHGLLSGLFKHHNKGCNTCAPTCGAPATCAAPAACTPATTCCADPCEVAQLIYESQTACYAKDRRRAIEKLGNKYDCICNPEIMTAFIVALNDCDERVRKEAADEIGDQIKRHCCCCPEVVAALTCALGDCDKGVVRQAKEALERCGYEVVDGCCNTCAAGPACGANGCAPAAAPAPMNGAPAPAPMPPAQGAARKSNLSNLLGLLD